MYSHANDHMRKTIDQTKYPLIHVTGEMRAISDLTHQSVVKVFGEQKNFVTMLCYVGDQNRAGALEVIYHTCLNWSSGVTWRQRFTALHLIVNGYVQIYATPQMEPIHYSVFGDGYILLQSKHAHDIEQKYVWLLEDRALNRFLRERAERSETKSKHIPAISFRDATSRIYGTPALNALMAIAKGSSIEIDPSYFRALRAIGFIKGRGGSVSLSRSGAEYLYSMTGWSKK